MGSSCHTSVIWRVSAKWTGADQVPSDYLFCSVRRQILSVILEGQATMPHRVLAWYTLRPATEQKLSEDDTQVHKRSRSCQISRTSLIC